MPAIMHRAAATAKPKKPMASWVSSSEPANFQRTSRGMAAVFIQAFMSSRIRLAALPGAALA